MYIVRLFNFNIYFQGEEPICIGTRFYDDDDDDDDDDDNNNNNKEFVHFL